MAEIPQNLKEWYGDLGFVVVFLVVVPFGRRVLLAVIHLVLLYEGLMAIAKPRQVLATVTVDKNFDVVHVYIIRVIGVTYLVQVMTFGLIERSGVKNAMTTVLKAYMLNLFLGLAPHGYLLIVNPSTLDVKLDTQMVRTIFTGRLLGAIGCFYYFIKSPPAESQKKPVQSDGQLYALIDAIILLVSGVTLMVMPWGIIYLTLYSAGREMEYDFFHNYLARIVGAMYINFALMSHYAARTSNIRVKNIIMTTHLMMYVAQLVLNLMLTPDWSLAQLSWLRLILQATPDLYFFTNSYLALTKNSVIATNKSQ